MTLWHSRKPRAFTMIELLVVIAIIGILAALLLPVLSRGKQRAQRVQCISNLQQVGTAFQMFSHDHGGRFPMETPQAEGGSQEYVTAGLNISGTFYFSYRHLQPLASELSSTRALTCPADLDRAAAENFNSLQNSNVSFFVNAYADYNEPASVLAGDRNITNDAATTASLVRGPYGLRWTRDLHFLKGNILFSDTHVEEMNNETMQLPGATLASAVFFLPAVPVSGAIAAGSPPFESTFSPTAAQNPPPPAPSPAPGSQASLTAPSQAPPAPQTPQGMAGSEMASHELPAKTAFITANARETHAAAATSNTPATAAPSDIEEGQPPLLWLQGAVGPVLEKEKWWLLLLLLLLAAALYFYVRRKIRKRQSRRHRDLRTLV